MTRILIVGAGAREHAIVDVLARGGSDREIVCAPGNPGIGAIARLAPVDAGDPDALLALTERERIDLTVVGPELPLDRGIADRFAARGHRILGPSRAAARLECSKAFAKAFMDRHGIPTARHRVCTNADGARALVDANELGLPVVIKADGLAAGKGVVVAPDRAAAHDAIRAAMDERQFGDAGAQVVIEECLEGPELSVFALCDGRRFVVLGSAQDHKRAYDDDRGPNTGGMGAFAPSPLFDATLEARVTREIIQPVVDGMRAEGHEYRGFLYVGLMLTSSGPKVIEFNVRFGDPEAQVVLPLLSSDPLAALVAAAEGRLDDTTARRVVERAPGVAVGVVLASAGYPGPSLPGVPIDGLDEFDGAGWVDGVRVFHAGTTMRDRRVVTAGGRILTVTAQASGFDAAIARAYAAVAKISFEGMHYRRDIGRRALAS